MHCKSKGEHKMGNVLVERNLEKKTQLKLQISNGFKCILKDICVYNKENLGGN